MRKLHFAVLAATLLTLGCFRETGVEIFNVTSSQTTTDNVEALALGKDATGRLGDYVIQNTNLQLIINGDANNNDRNLYLEKSGGSVFDFASRFRLRGSSTINSRDDDGIGQLTQGVNMNYRTLVSYDRIVVGQISEGSSSITLTGSIYDMDGSLEAQGAAVDSQTRRLLNCEVTTTYTLNDLEQSGDSNLPVLWADASTQITNTGQLTLPIYALNDIIASPQGNHSNFVAYPDWGFEKPADGSLAYPPYVNLQPRQAGGAQYVFLSRLDGVVKATWERVPERVMDVTYVGKATGFTGGLPAGESRSFIREMMVVNSGSRTSASSSAITTFLNTSVLLTRDPAPESLFSKLGSLSAAFLTNGSPGGKVVMSYIDQSVDYFDGQQYKTLEAGRKFPIFGDSRLNTTYDFFTVSSTERLDFLPIGKLQMDVQALNSTPLSFTQAVREVVDDGSGTTTDPDPEPLIILEGELFVTKLILVADLHRSVSISLRNSLERDLFGRAMFTRTSEGEPISISDMPGREQGNVQYLNSVSTGTTLNLVSTPLPVGDYEVVVNHGHLYDVTTRNFTVEPASSSDDTTNNGSGDTTGTGDENTASDTSFIAYTLTMDRLINMDGWWSADFDSRSDGDPLGTVNANRLVRQAESEDLDVVFTPNSFNLSLVELEFEALAFSLSGFEKDDRDGNVQSLKDELVPSRAAAVIGRDTEGKPLGRFSILNQTRFRDKNFLEIPRFRNDPAGFYDRVRAANAEHVILLGNPRRAKGFETGLFTAIAEKLGQPADQPLAADNSYFTRKAATGSDTTWLDFDIMQVLAGHRYDEYLLCRRDWFNLLNAGIFKPAVGGSDGWETKDLPIGAVRTWVPVGSEEVHRDNKLESFWTAVREGRGFVSNGPLIEASLEGAGFSEAVAVSGETATLSLTVRAVPWVPVHEVRVIVDGGEPIILPGVDPNSQELVRLTGSFEIPIPNDGQRHWLVIEAGSTLAELAAGVGDSGLFGKVQPGHLPLAFTNPIFFD